MLTLLGSPRRTCDGMTRRESLTAGALSALGGLSLPALQAAEQRIPGRQGKVKNVIVLYLLGGAATQDMYDLKPNAPDKVRSAFQPIATNVPGIQVCEHLPRLAQWMHRIALVRSMTHQAGCHNPLPTYTGSEQPLPNIVTTSPTYPPSIGSVCEWLRQTGRGQRRYDPTALPDYVYMPNYLGWGQAIRRPGPYAGFLGQAYEALYTEVAPFGDKGAVHTAGNPAYVYGRPQLPESTLAEGLTLDRLDQRRGLLTQFDERLRQVASSLAVAGFDKTQQRAFTLLTSSAVRAAFDIDREPPPVRERYGNTLFGQTTLMARRLIEAGVRFVNVTWDLYWDRCQLDYDAWDTHNKNFPVLKFKLPILDQVLTALLDDLHQRGLLDETLILMTSEMGRTPSVNGNGGRDHWTYCYGNLLAGGGIRGGTVVGASDAQAAYVKDRPVRPKEIVATLYELLGIGDDLMVPDRDGRPVSASQNATAVRELIW